MAMSNDSRLQQLLYNFFDLILLIKRISIRPHRN